MAAPPGPFRDNGHGFWPLMERQSNRHRYIDHGAAIPGSFGSAPEAPLKDELKLPRLGWGQESLQQIG